ncbi:MAG: VOC family protein [Acidimicrobiales bacterium]
MPTDPVVQAWSIRSTLIAVTDLDRSVAFYRELGPFEEIVREDAVAVLGDGDVSPRSTILILRETRGIHNARHGQQSLGLRSMTFNVGSLAELDRIESVLRSREVFTSRREVAEGASELIRGRDPDNMPLAFVRYPEGESIGTDYWRAVANLVYALDV